MDRFTPTLTVLEGRETPSDGVITEMPLSPEGDTLFIRVMVAETPADSVSVGRVEIKLTETPGVEVQLDPTTEYMPPSHNREMYELPALKQEEKLELELTMFEPPATSNHAPQGVVTKK